MICSSLNEDTIRSSNNDTYEETSKVVESNDCCDNYSHQKQNRSTKQCDPDHNHASCDGSFHHLQDTSCCHNHRSGLWAYVPHAHSLHDRIKADKRSHYIACVIFFFTFIVQIGSALWVNSCVLFAEVVHTGLDFMFVLMSLISIHFTERERSARYTYGLGRAEVLSALLSVVSMIYMIANLGHDSYQKIITWSAPSARSAMIKGRFVFVAEAITLINNILIACALAAGSKSLNVRALHAHVIADTIGNIIVLIAGVVMWVQPKAAILDPIFTLLIAAGIAYLNYPLAIETLDVFMQATPSKVSLPHLISDIEEIAGIESVIDLHMWTVTSGVLVATVKAKFNTAIDDFISIDSIRSEIKRLCTNLGVTDCTVELDMGLEYAQSSYNSIDIIEEQSNALEHENLV